MVVFCKSRGRTENPEVIEVSIVIQTKSEVHYECLKGVALGTSWMVGPSAIGSENGTPVTFMSVYNTKGLSGTPSPFHDLR
jgi:hypothetical protein